MMYRSYSFLILLLLLATSACSQHKAGDTNKIKLAMDSSTTATAQVAKMQIEVWSDIMCPFCYIGKRHYEAALQQFAHRDNVEIVWKSFQLDPDIPQHMERHTNVYAYLAERKGISLAQSQSMHARVVDMAKAAGLDYHFENAVVANSLNAHRIIQLAKTKHLGDQAEECFFKAYFTEGADLANEATLVSIGKKIGLTEADVNEALTNQQYLQLVQQDVREADSIGVNGVPFFVFDRKYAVSGAQPVDTFLQTLDHSYSEWKKNRPVSLKQVTSSDVCKPGGECK